MAYHNHDNVTARLTQHAGPKERHLETLVHNTLHSIILTRLLPRTLVQITLQIRSLPEEEAATGVNTVCDHHL